MKRILFLLMMLLAFANGNSQVLDPVKWKTKVEKISDTEFNLVFEDSKGNFTLVGKTTESATHKRFNSDFGVDELYFEKKAVLKQRVKITNLKLKTISASVDYQTCKD